MCCGLLHLSAYIYAIAACDSAIFRFRNSVEKYVKLNGNCSTAIAYAAERIRAVDASQRFQNEFIAQFRGEISYSTENFLTHLLKSRVSAADAKRMFRSMCVTLRGRAQIHFNFRFKFHESNWKIYRFILWLNVITTHLNEQLRFSHDRMRYINGRLIFCQRSKSKPILSEHDDGMPNHRNGWCASKPHDSNKYNHILNEIVMNGRLPISLSGFVSFAWNTSERARVQFY